MSAELVNAIAVDAFVLCGTSLSTDTELNGAILW